MELTNPVELDLYAEDLEESEYGAGNGVRPAARTAPFCEGPLGSAGWAPFGSPA
ncbi:MULTISPECIES: hypothetical protein [Polymorphospora]|uniref:Uncharacterized protein n=1 Tax=Polymorphospora lycopeni TaxID=3140240 RepID=A0ABV5D1D9_9ACTN